MAISPFHHFLHQRRSEGTFRAVTSGRPLVHSSPACAGAHLLDRAFRSSQGTASRYRHPRGLSDLSSIRHGRVDAVQRDSHAQHDRLHRASAGDEEDCLSASVPAHHRGRHGADQSCAAADRPFRHLYLPWASARPHVDPVAGWDHPDRGNRIRSRRYPWRDERIHPRYRAGHDNRAATLVLADADCLSGQRLAGKVQLCAQSQPDRAVGGVVSGCAVVQPLAKSGKPDRAGGFGTREHELCDCVFSPRKP